MTNYEQTHVSLRDDSPAMFLSEDNEANTYTLMNEDGHVWSDPQDDWISLAELEHDQTYSFAPVEEQDPMGYNSDSYINYLNRS